MGPTRRQGPLLTRFGFTAISYSLWVGVTNGASAVEFDLANAGLMIKMRVVGAGPIKVTSVAHVVSISGLT